jgi:hypothetical protein
MDITAKCRSVIFVIILVVIISSVFTFVTPARRCSILRDLGRDCREIKGDDGYPHLAKYGTFTVLMVGDESPRNITTFCSLVVRCAESGDGDCDLQPNTAPIYYCDDTRVSRRYLVYPWQLFIWTISAAIIGVALVALACTR